ncbi:hypothetical protein [Maribellus sp. YY47]|uniref:hypothetical protein n=1 Tax=Maribellus sp. YY47 TaxID=2929486 RepID=UPI002000B770|nr:hypothetical protein [Maribellus sp. YY47]MCK3685429.1 hypothetical protein [Maribellus sp. YY47]
MENKNGGIALGPAMSMSQETYCIPVLIFVTDFYANKTDFKKKTRRNGFSNYNHQAMLNHSNTCP